MKYLKRLWYLTIIMPYVLGLMFIEFFYVILAGQIDPGPWIPYLGTKIKWKF
jgi:hypothetical protein